MRFKVANHQNNIVQVLDTTKILNMLYSVASICYNIILSSLLKLLLKLRLLLLLIVAITTEEQLLITKSNFQYDKINSTEDDTKLLTMLPAGSIVGALYHKL
jgi:hypothetical protein